MLSKDWKFLRFMYGHWLMGSSRLEEQHWELSGRVNY